MEQKDNPPIEYVSPRRKKFMDKKMPRKFFLALVFVAIAGVGYIGGMAHGQVIDSIRGALGKESDLDVSSLQETYRALVNNFDGEIDQQKLIDGANRGMVDALGDQHTSFMSGTEAEEFNNNLSGDIGGGIGVEVGVRNDQPTVLRVLRDNPAEKAGVQVGDVFVAVNDESVIGKTVQDVVSKVRGESGTTVKVTFYRAGSEVDVSITRENVNNPSVYGSVEDGIGIMTVLRFDGETGSLARSLAQEFKDANVKSVVLDLRGNGGGYVSAAKELASVWLNDKIIVVEKTGGRVVEEVRSGNNAMLEGIPTVVLVNQSSASASEIIAGAFRGHDVAQIVGEVTFGKGSVQRLVSLSNNATLKVTVARWYTPSGLNISDKGISPDVKIERTAEDVNANRDPQLDKAKALLK